VSGPPVGVDQTPDEYLPCRDGNPTTCASHRRAREIECVLLCANCETLRTQVLSLDGYLLQNWYLYPRTATEQRSRIL